MAESKVALCWKKLDAGEYATTDGRFEAFRAYDRVHGEHWILRDANVDDYYKSRYDEDTLKECKAVAEAIVNQEIKRGVVCA